MADQTIHCQLAVHSLDSKPAYTALSYTWGGNTKEHPLVIDGVTVRITANLATALQRIAEDNSMIDVGWLWIDSICINQQDNYEKSSQVQKMRDICSRASKAVVWLGPADATSAEAMAMLEELGKEVWRSNDLLSPAQGDIFDEPARLWSAMKAIGQLFSRPWWTRAWVAQEHAMAKAGFFFCGSQLIHGNLLYTACASLKARSQIKKVVSFDNAEATSDSQWTAIPGSLSTAIAVLGVRYKRDRGHVSSLNGLLNHGIASRMQATDPRDLVFALLGMAGDAEELGIDVDYGQTCEEVYTAVATAYIGRGVLQQLGLCETFGRLSNLPSWVPDFSSFTLPENRTLSSGISSKSSERL